MESALKPNPAFFSRVCRPEEFFRNQSWSLNAAVIGCASLFGFIFFKLSFAHLSDVFLGVLAIAFLIAIFRAPPRARRDPALLFFFAATALGLISYFHSRWMIPQYAERYPMLDILLNLFLMYIVAWWLGGKTRNVLVFLSMALAGLGVALLVHGSAADVKGALAGLRVGFGLRHPQHAAMFFAVGIIGWVVFANRVIGERGHPGAVVRTILWAIVLLLLLGGSVVTQTRAAWLGLAVVAALAAGGLLFSSRARDFVRPKLPLIVLGAVVSFVVLGLLARNIVIERLGQEHKVIEQIVDGDARDVPETSIGIRVKLWSASLNWIKKRPLLGWGYNGRSHVISDSPDLPQDIKAQFGHLHNSYIEVLLIYGITGMVLIAVYAAWIGKCAWEEWRSGNMPDDVFYFGVCFFAYWLVVNLFESYIIWSAGTYLVTIVGGVIYTYTTRRYQHQAA